VQRDGADLSWEKIFRRIKCVESTFDFGGKRKVQKFFKKRIYFVFLNVAKQFSFLILAENQFFLPENDKIL